MTTPVDLLVQGATVVDGTGAAPATADLAVAGDRIVAVGDEADGLDAGKTIDADGAALSAGFVDVHTHDDWAVLVDPDLGPKTLQGVTSVVTGNCGMSPFPESDLAGSCAGFAPLSDYLGALEAQPSAVNIAALVGHGAIRTAVMGLRTDRSPDAGERSAMADLLAEALADGAVGMSSGLAYQPGCYAAADELLELAGLVADAGGIYATHMRDEAGGPSIRRAPAAST